MSDSKIARMAEDLAVDDISDLPKTPQRKVCFQDEMMEMEIAPVRPPLLRQHAISEDNKVCPIQSSSTPEPTSTTYEIYNKTLGSKYVVTVFSNGDMKAEEEYIQFKFDSTSTFQENKGPVIITSPPVDVEKSALIDSDTETPPMSPYQSPPNTPPTVQKNSQSQAPDEELEDYNVHTPPFSPPRTPRRLVHILRRVSSHFPTQGRPPTPVPEQQPLLPEGPRDPVPATTAQANPEG